MGRVMRPHESKEFALWLDHSGNYLRFRDDWDDVYANGVTELDKKTEKTKKEPTEREKKESKCPECGYLWPVHADTCPSCGHVRQRRNQVSSVAGELVELAGNVTMDKKQSKQDFFSQLLYIAEERAYNSYWANHKYKEKFGVWPRGLDETKTPPTLTTMNWVKSQNIRWQKGKNK
jgi:hypothetical protein